MNTSKKTSTPETQLASAALAIEEARESLRNSERRLKAVVKAVRK